MIEPKIDTLTAGAVVSTPLLPTLMELQLHGLGFQILLNMAVEVLVNSEGTEQLTL